MPYIGNTSPSRFVSNRAASVYSGDGSTTAFTLEQAVAQDEDVLVSVDGVIQEPSVAYAVSNGTTLTFTGAPSSNSGNNIFVYYLASQVGTVGHPAAQNLSAGTGTFTGDVTIGDASAADKKILFDGNAVDYHIGLDDSADSLIIGKGSTLGTTTSMIFDANGIITKPLQPAFRVSPSSTQSNMPINAQTTVAFGTERFDQNGDFASNTFTAPVTGKYQLSFALYLNETDTAGILQGQIVTSNSAEYYDVVDLGMFDADGQYGLNVSALADMDANDTAYVTVYLSNAGAAQMDINTVSHFSGFLAC
tara:strand:+ start:700 stop:1617 length:918 start_codon:yes stop_codon:yes gene_type:complete